MSSVSIALTDPQESILSPYAASIGKTVAALVAEQGISAAIQNALRAFSDKVAREGSVDTEIAAQVLKDSNAIFMVMWNDFSGSQKFVGLAAAHLAGSAT